MAENEPAETGTAQAESEQAEAPGEEVMGLEPEPETEAVPVMNLDEGKEETAVPETPTIEMSRKQLYDEIWEMSVAGVAKKYDIPYTFLMKQVKEAGIPIPPSGYWTKLSFGRPVSRLDLPEPVNEVLSIVRSAPVTPKRIGSKADDPSSTPAILQKGEATPLLDEKETDFIPSAEVNEMAGDVQDRDEPEIFEQYGQSYNVYDRETLYKEVWACPVTEVAKRYRVSDVAIHKVCKALDVPTPPAGYWAKLRAGKPVTKLPLPESNKPAKKTGLRIGTESQPKVKEETLSFLSEEDKSVVLSVAMQIRIPDENARMHPTIVAHRKTVREWKKLKNRQGTGLTPFLADTVAEETLPRVFRIIDALIKAMEPLGCSLTSDLQFIVNGETVSVSISEAKDQTDHVLTKEEHVQLLEYEENKRRNKWASRPDIRKYDYAYNGHISFMVSKTKRFRDSKASVVEDRLGDIMIELYEAFDAIRRERDAQEEAERKRQEDERRKEERRERYNAEVESTLALENLANDFDTACKIRRYVSALETSGDLSERQKAWIEWAKAKADWYDPTIAREDDFFGKRKHEEEVEQKKLKHAGHRWL